MTIDIAILATAIVVFALTWWVAKREKRRTAALADDRREQALELARRELSKAPSVGSMSIPTGSSHAIQELLGGRRQIPAMICPHCQTRGGVTKNRNPEEGCQRR
jgi:hypothetical protein